MADASNAGKAPSRFAQYAVAAGLLAVVVAGLAGLAAATGWEETWAQLMQLSLGQIVLLLALSLANYFARAIRWHLFARKLGLPTTLLQDTRHFLGGFALTVTPGRVGELIRMRWLRRETGWAFERTAPLVVVDRAADLAAMGALLGVALALSAGGIAFAVPVAVLAIAAAFVATRPSLLRWAVTIGWRITGVFPRLWARIRTAAKSLALFRGIDLTLPVAALSIAGWLAEGYALYLLLIWMDAPIDFWMAVAIFIFASLAGGLTGAPGGLGGAEAAIIALLATQGVGLEVSVPATAVIRLTTLWFAIVIGMAVFPAAERISLAAKRAHGR